ALVVAPPDEPGGVPEPTRQHVLVAHLDDPLDAQRLPRQVLLRVPAAHPARHAGGPLVRGRLGPRPPGGVVQRALSQRLDLGEQLPAQRGGEGGRDADVVQAPGAVVEAEPKPAPSNRRNQSSATSGSSVTGVSRTRSCPPATAPSSSCRRSANGAGCRSRSPSASRSKAT